MERGSARVKVRFPAAKDSGSGTKRQLPGYGRQFLAQVTMYFFYDFLADCSVKDMWFCFWSFGKVADVFIPARRDRRGGHFGFVHMSEVSNVKDMEHKLNQIWLGSYHLKVVAGNVVASEEGVSSNNDVRQVEITKGMEPVVDVVPETIPERNTVPLTSEGRVEERSSPKTDLVLEFTPNDEEVAWLKRSMVAMVRSLDMVKKIQNRLDVDGLLVNVALLGGHHIILVDYSEGCLEEFISHNSELVESWFEWIQPMSLSTMSPVSRLVWLRFTGVPLKAWSERCFTELGGLIGEVILVDEDTRSKSFLCEGRVLILSEEKSKISTSIALQVDSKAFPITVQEEEWMMDPGLVSTRLNWTEKKRRSLGTIYAGVSGMEKPRKDGTSWVTARIKARRNRRGTDLQMDEVRELFLMGQNLGIQCQQNEEEVISRLAALKERDGVTFGLGNLGGLLSIWNKSNFVKERVIEGNGFIGISGEWGKQRLKCNLVNVYAPCDRQRKAMLWEEMGKLVLEEGGRWLLAGDFNAVRNGAERKGRLGGTQDMGDFNQFVEGCGLIDVRLRNRKFTWYRPDGSSMSKLDRFLLSTEMSLLDKDWFQVGVQRSISDHCALILTSRNIDWGPKPFRVLDAWQQHPDFKDIVEDKWKTLQIEGWAAFQCKQKLKLLKEDCKGWNRGVFGNVETQLDTRLKHIERLEKKSEEEELSENEVLLRKECFQEMWDIFRRKEAVWKQKSRNNWVRMGDANTAFFPQMRADKEGTECNRWLRRVMADIISESQSAFVRGRQLVDSVLVLNEVVDEVKKKKQESFIFKADFEKAYDCVDWDILDWMMDRMGFGVKWRKWIRECLSTARISILLNGSPTSEFSVSKGLRQGDLLSPFLFLLVGEGLCGLVKKAECEGLLKGLEIGRGGMVLSLL
ncbi:hypothetical protein SLEP1_g32427 [Rubroshorea leprosula]|uniref:Uncharacterized protein n=1 Tax=Rubroshorea leprosula TaxID=152421 RepID=A0AAV5KDF9_9ROSI|nr:hypothetical protein SLEP1_g32427 [Rubroshorea leprosula]